MKTFRVKVTQYIEVTLDETKFTPEFMAEFDDTFFELDGIEGHAEHLGQLYARGCVPGYADDEIEGYGEAREFGISFWTLDHDSQIDDE